MTERRHAGAVGFERSSGTVADFDAGVGLGTILDVSGDDVPFHCVEIADGSRTIDVGAAVTFGLITKLGRVEAVAIAT